MGQQIVYCEVCGERILEADLDSGKAVVIAGRDYCAKCRDKAPKVVVGGGEHRQPPPPTTRRTTVTPGTSKLEHTRHGHASNHSHPRYVAPPAKQAPLVIGAVIGALLILLAAFAFMPGTGAPPPVDPIVRRTTSPTPPPTPEVDPLRIARDQYDRLRDYARERKDDPEAVIARIEAELPRLAGTPFAADVQSILSEARKTLDRINFEKLEKKVSELLARAATEAVEDPRFENRAEIQAMFGEARHAAGSAGDLVARVTEAEKGYQEAFEQAAEASAGSILDRARDLDKEHHHQKCLEALAEFPSSFEGTDAARRIAEAKEEYQRSWDHCKEENAKKPAMYRDYQRLVNALSGGGTEAAWNEAAAFFEKAIPSLSDFDVITKQGLTPQQRNEISIMGRYTLAAFCSRIKRDLDKGFVHFEELLRLGGSKVMKYPLDGDGALAELRPDPRFKAMLEKYEKKYSLDRRWLGFFGPALLKEEAAALKVPDGQGGVHIVRLIQGGMAAKIGLQAGDIVVGFAGKKLGRAAPLADLDALFDRTKPGADYEVEALRGGERVVFTARW